MTKDTKMILIMLLSIGAGVMFVIAENILFSLVGTIPLWLAMSILFASERTKS